jgi:ribose transport system substrate-binding protein
VSRFLHLTVVAAVGIGLACLPACNRGPKKTKVGVVTNCTADFWSICEAGAKKAAQENDVELVFRQPTNMDAAEQLPIIEGFLAQGCKGIAVSVIDPKGQTEDLSRIAKQVPLITMDNDADKTGRRCYVGIDNKEAGKAVARLVKKALPNGGTVAMFIGSVASANGQARTQGVLDGLAGQDNAQGIEVDHPAKPAIKCKKYGDYYLVDKAPRTDDGKSDVATNNATDVLTRLDGVDNVCLIGLYAYNPPAILNAVTAKKLTGKVKIVGFDEDWSTLGGVKDGSIEGTVVQDPFAYGYKSVEILAALARGDESKLPKETDRIAYRVVTKDANEPLPAGPEVVRVKAIDLETKLRADLASVKG